MVSSESLLKAAGAGDLPPVEKWNPKYCGEIDIRIDKAGQWFYQGTPIGRRRMQVLFSRILKKEAQEYFLVTPVEKVKIQVEWMPFTIVDFDVIQNKGKTTYIFIDNCDNKVELTRQEQFQLDYSLGMPLPIVLIRRNLYAGFSRGCYYRLLDTAQEVKSQDKISLLIESSDLQFSLGQLSDDINDD